MKICPTCQTQFKDGSMRFCTKDGTPLINFVPPVIEEPPVIVEEPTLVTPVSTLPSAAAPPSQLDETLNNIPKSSSPSNNDPDHSVSAVSTADSVADEMMIDLPNPRAVQESEKFIAAPEAPEPVKQAVVPPPAKAASSSKRAASTQASPAQPKRKSKVALYVILGVLAVFGLLGIVGAAGAYLYFSSSSQSVAVINTNSENVNSERVDDPANINSNNDDGSVDTNTNAETNSSVDENINSNLDGNVDANLNINGITNLNARPSPSPRTSPSPSPRNSNRNANQIIEMGPSQPTPVPTVVQQPTPNVQQSGVRTIAGGVVNGKASSLIKPAYPASAKAVRAEGQVNVQVLIDENGNVVSASAISGNPLLRQAAQQAARQSKFPPTVIGGQQVRVSGVIIYSFTMNQ